MTPIDTVIVRWRGGNEVSRCLRSLLDFGGPHLERVVLVDSGSGDGGAKRLAAEFPEVRVVALTENHGFAHAADRGATEGAAPLLLVLNPDTEVTPGALDALASLLDERPRVAGAVPLIEDMDGASQHRWQLRNLPTVSRLARGLPGGPAFSARPTTPVEVAQPAAAAWLVRRSVWEALGGLDPTFAPAWWEDVDFCARLRAGLITADFPCDKGFVVQTAAHLRHAGGSSVAALGDAAFLTAYYRNLLRYTARHHPGHLGLVRRGLRISLAARALLRPSRRKAYKAALEAITRDWGRRSN
jgi:GT2 family glycosyltransferase